MKYKINWSCIVVIILVLYMIIFLLMNSKWKDNNMEDYEDLPFGITDEEFEDIEEIKEVEDNNVWSFVKTLLWTWLQKI